MTEPTILPIETAFVPPVEAGFAASAETRFILPIEAGFVTPIKTGFIAPVKSSFMAPIRPAQSGQSIFVDDPLGGPQQDPPNSNYSGDDMSDSLSFTSSFPDVFDVGMDDSAPSATGPWMIVDHLTGEMTVDGELPSAIPTVSSAPFDSVIQVQIILGALALVQTAPPTLLFEDRDERPDWLVWSTNEFLQHVPYYMCLGRVVDLFFAQEARLGYPDKVKTLFSFMSSLADTSAYSLSPLASPYHLEIDPRKLPHL